MDLQTELRRAEKAALAAGALLSGLVAVGWFVGADWEHFWGHAVAVKATESVIHHMHEVPLWAKLLPLIMGIGGIALSYVYYVVQPDLPGRTVAAFRSLHRLFFNKWYFDELYDAVFVQPALAIGRFFWKKGDGATIDIGLSATHVDTASGTAGFLITFQDLTDVKKQERDARLQQRLAAVGEMAAGIAHEIRNPLASMSGSIQILRDDLPLNAEQAQLMDIVLRESDRLNTIIKSFLEYARPHRFAVARFDVRRVLQDADDGAAGTPTRFTVTGSPPTRTWGSASTSIR